jgi:hypothetical protein
MARSKALVLAALAAFGLAACNDNGRGGMARGDNRLCTPFTTTAEAPATAAPGVAPGVAPPVVTDPGAALDDCLHRWGYSLAASSDDADTVAAATVAACSPMLARWNQQSLAPAQGGSAAPTVEAPSLLTGEPTTPLAEHYNYAHNRALFYVVQARAGKCPPPPIANGAPGGTTTRPGT